ncbi:MAG: hypothetical protein HC767_14105 [Akkermansiaceae bacterium]|nr:hypothetical protein [Akkermansiaceae bacterium]
MKHFADELLTRCQRWRGANSFSRRGRETAVERRSTRSYERAYAMAGEKICRSIFLFFISGNGRDQVLAHE